MKYHIIEPEVSGGLGEGTILDRTVHPPQVSALQYKFDGWLGDVLVESFPCFIVAIKAAEKLRSIPATGMQLTDVRVTMSDQFCELFPNLSLPEFRWLKVTEKAGQDDFGLTNDHRLVMSERALSVLKPLGLSNALISDFR